VRIRHARSDGSQLCGRIRDERTRRANGLATDLNGTTFQSNRTADELAFPILAALICKSRDAVSVGAPETTVRRPDASRM